MRSGAQIKKAPIIAIIVIAVLVADQIVKAVITANLAPYETIEVIPGLFNIVNVMNPGAAFGIFREGGGTVLTVISVVAVAVIAYLLYHVRERLQLIALSLIGGGAAGNMVDRFRHGEVVDFLDIYMGAYHWPAFNVADSAITVGVILYIYYSRSWSETALKKASSSGCGGYASYTFSPILNAWLFRKSLISFWSSFRYIGDRYPSAAKYGLAVAA